MLGGGDRKIEREVRVNERIRAREVRVIDENGAQLGIMAVPEALRLARQRDLDLIEVAPNAQPPVVRIMDYGKHRYEQQKKEREAHKKTKTTEVRMLRWLTPQIDKHDLEVKVKKLRELLLEGDKVRVQLRFRGREMSRPQMGHAVMRQIAESAADISIVEAAPRLEGRILTMLIAPKPGLRAPKKEPAAPKPQSAQEPAAREAPAEPQAPQAVLPPASAKPAPAPAAPRQPATAPEPMKEEPTRNEHRTQAENSEDGGETG